MSFILPMNVLKIQEELKQYRDLCNAYNHSPAKKEFEDIVNYILLFSGDGINESFGGLKEIDDSTMTYLFESFNEDLNEAGSSGPHTQVDGEAEFDTAVGVVTGTAKKALTGLAVGAAAAGMYIAFLFKRGKLKSSLAQEAKLDTSKLGLYQKIIDLAVQLAKLKDEPAPKLSDLTAPSPTSTPAMPDKPKGDDE